MLLSPITAPFKLLALQKSVAMANPAPSQWHGPWSSKLHLLNFLISFEQSILHVRLEGIKLYLQVGRGAFKY